MSDPKKHAEERPEMQPDDEFDLDMEDEENLDTSIGGALRKPRIDDYER